MWGKATGDALQPTTHSRGGNWQQLTPVKLWTNYKPRLYKNDLYLQFSRTESHLPLLRPQPWLWIEPAQTLKATDCVAETRRCAWQADISIELIYRHVGQTGQAHRSRWVADACSRQHPPRCTHPQRSSSAEGLGSPQEQAWRIKRRTCGCGCGLSGWRMLTD